MAVLLFAGKPEKILTALVRARIYNEEFSKTIFTKA